MDERDRELFERLCVALAAGLPEYLRAGWADDLATDAGSLLQAIRAAEGAEKPQLRAPDLSEWVKLHKDLAATADKVHALRVENDGLRAKLAEAESRVACLTGALPDGRALPKHWERVHTEEWAAAMNGLDAAEAIIHALVDERASQRWLRRGMADELKRLAHKPSSKVLPAGTVPERLYPGMVIKYGVCHFARVARLNNGWVTLEVVEREGEPPQYMERPVSVLTYSKLTAPFEVPNE